MPYQRLMHAMVNELDGAAGAVFLDQEGEAVVTTERTLGKYDLQVIGAYAGIFLSQVKRAASDAGLGAAEQFKLQCKASTLLITDLKDGYYLVLVLNRDANEAIAWHRLHATRDRFVQEL